MHQSQENGLVWWRSGRHRGQHPQQERSSLACALAAAQHASSADPFYKVVVAGCGSSVSLAHLFTLTLVHSGDCGASLASVNASACTAAQLHFCSESKERVVNFILLLHTSGWMDFMWCIGWKLQLARQLLQCAFHHCPFLAKTLFSAFLRSFELLLHKNLF